jgi:hypothetical protein
MAEKTYITRVGSFGHLKNREVVEKAAMEGRTVPALVDYLPLGSEVKLDPSHPLTKKAHESGAIELPGESSERRKSELEQELERLKAREEQLKGELGSGDPSQLKGEALDQALRDAGLSTEGKADEKRARLAAAQTPPA